MPVVVHPLLAVALVVVAAAQLRPAKVEQRHLGCRRGVGQREALGGEVEVLRGLAFCACGPPSTTTQEVVHLVHELPTRPLLGWVIWVVTGIKRRCGQRRSL